MEVYITYTDSIDKLNVGDYPDVKFFLYNSMSRKTQKKAKTLKGHWAAKLDPFIVIKEGDQIIKVLYSESKEDVIELLIKYLNQWKH